MLYLSFYPASYMALLLLARSRTDSFRSSLWLDGAIAALTVAALVATLAFQPIVDATSGGPAEIAVNLAYPVGDLLLLGLVVAVFGLNGWRPDPVVAPDRRRPGPHGGADGLYLVQSARTSTSRATLLDVAWPASALLVAVAAWQPARRTITIQRLADHRRAGGLRPRGGAAARLRPLRARERRGVSLAAWALLLALARMALAFLENQRASATSHAEARTDSLTGLRNRRCLLADLEVSSSWRRCASPRALLLFDLDGFKEYNDAFGHPAGDGLLVRLAARLAEAVGSTATPTAWVGTSSAFWSRRPRTRVDASWSRRCSAALHERGEGFEVTSSFGVVLLPEEADTPTLALQLADRRMYARKGGRRHVGRAPVARRPAAHAVRAAARPPRPPSRHRRAGACRRARASAWAPRGWTRWPAPPSSTTSARSRCPTRSSTSPARSTRSSGASCAAIR